MITKYTLTIDGIEHEIDEDGAGGSVKNWSDIICAYKRSDYGGAVRSFSSKFQFVGEAYELLLALFLRDGYDAEALLKAYVIRDDRSWEEWFSCELDFSTKSVADGVFSIGAVDNSLAALIKSGKSAKYEMEVGAEVPTSGVFRFERLPMQESAEYAFTMGETDEQTGAIRIAYEPPEDGSQAMWLGKKSEEVAIKGPVMWKDDQKNDASGFMAKAASPARVSVSSLIRLDIRGNGGAVMDICLVRLGSSGEEKSRLVLATAGGKAPHPVGEFVSPAELNAQHPTDGYVGPEMDYGQTGLCAIVSGSVYRLAYNGRGCEWTDTGKSEEEFFITESEASCEIDMDAGDMLRVIGGAARSWLKAASSSIRLGWEAIGEAVDVPCISPQALGSAIMGRIAKGRLNVRVLLSGHDSRLANTALMAAESVRDMPSAKIYSSFAEYCDWLSVVFGYAYCIGERRRSRFTRPNKAAGFSDGAAVLTHGEWRGDVAEASVCYMNSYGMFMYRGDDMEYYRQWEGWQDYNDPGSGQARTDTLYCIGGAWAYFGDSGEKIAYDGDPEDSMLDSQELVFKHRTEIFRDDAPVKVIANAKGVSNSTVTSQIYSTVEIGYDKKDYDQANGRDEWNFENCYTTGCLVSDRKLTMKSKYRCDCYGLEFAVQKRGKDTTDSDSDSDVFFAHCLPNAGNGVRLADRVSCPVAGALSDKVFNGAFSPMRCVLANAGYIGMQASSMTLRFSSSKGNSGIIAGGLPMSGDIELSSPLMMSESLEFTTDDDALPAGIDDLVEVEDSGITYRGYVSEIEMRMAKESSVKYKLHIKSIFT